jgi:hypothetical protein
VALGGETVAALFRHDRSHFVFGKTFSVALDGQHVSDLIILMRTLHSSRLKASIGKIRAYLSRQNESGNQVINVEGRS